jgi:glucose/mannose transport system permease protein
VTASTDVFIWLRRVKRLAAVYLPLLLAGVFFLIPIFVMINTGLKSFAEVKFQEMWLLPKQPTLDAFWQAVQKLSINIRNSFMVSLPGALISAFIGSMNGYVLTKWRFRGANLIYVFIIFGIFIPLQTILIPLVVVLRNIGLYGTIPGLILAHVVYGIPITTLMFRNYYVSIPDSLIESASLEGIGIVRIYRSICLPLSGPVFGVTFIWQFTQIWNEFLFSLVITQDPNVQPVNVALANLAGSYYVEWNVQMAGAIVVGAPTLLIYVFLGKFLIRGLLAGSIKS